MSIPMIPPPPTPRPQTDVDTEVDAKKGSPLVAKSDQHQQATTINKQAWNEVDAYEAAAVVANTTLQNKSAADALREQQIQNELAIVDADTQKTQQERTDLETKLVALYKERDAKTILFNKLVSKLGKVEATLAGLQAAMYRINHAEELLRDPILKKPQRAPAPWWELPAFMVITVVCACLSSLGFVSIFGGRHNSIARLQITPPLLLGMAFAAMLIGIIGSSAEYLTRNSVEDIRLHTRLSVGAKLGIAVIALFVCLEALGDGVGLFMIAQRSVLLAFADIPTWLIALITCPLALLISLPPVAFKVMRVWGKERAYEESMRTFAVESDKRTVLASTVALSFDRFDNMEAATETVTQIELLNREAGELQSTITTKRAYLATLAEKKAVLDGELRTLTESQAIPFGILRKFEEHAEKIRGLIQQVELCLKV